jgi:hypothetical protein
VTATGRVAKQEPVGRLPHLVRDVQGGGFGEVVPQPPGPLHVRLGPGFDSLAIQAETISDGLRSSRLPLSMGGHVSPAQRPSVALQRTPQPKHRIPMLLDAAAHHRIGR